MARTELLTGIENIWEFDKVVKDRLPGTVRTIERLQSTNNDENPFVENQRTRPGERAQNPLPGKQQILKPETKRQALSDAQYTQQSQRHQHSPFFLSHKTPKSVFKIASLLRAGVFLHV